MPKKEKFGKFVLLEEVETSGLGAEYRAAKLSATGLEKIVTLLRVRPNLSSSAETVKSLMDQVKFAAQLQNPNIVKLFGIGKVDASFYISHEFIEGKSLQAVFNRGKQEGFPFSVDHALLIVSKVCSALEYAHARKTEGGVRYFHGMVTPANVIVSYEGEVRTRGFGYWPARVREAGGLTDEEMLYLAPEQAAGGVGDTRSDLFAVGALLFQMITGEAFFQIGREIDIAKRLVAEAKLLNPTTDDDALPKPIREILQKLADPGPGGALRRSPGDAQGRGHAPLLRRLRPDDVQPRLLHAFALPRGHRPRVEDAEGGEGSELHRVHHRRRAQRARHAAADGRSVRGRDRRRRRRGRRRHAAVVRRPSSPSPTHRVPVAVAAAPAPPQLRRRRSPSSRGIASSSALPLVPPPPKSSSHAHAHAHGSSNGGAHATASGGSGASHAAAHPPETASAREAAAGFTFHKDEKKGGKTALIGGLAAVLLVGARRRPS